MYSASVTTSPAFKIVHFKIYLFLIGHNNRPEKFNQVSKEEKEMPVDDYKENSSSDSDDDDLFVNTNRPECKVLVESSEDSDEDEES